MAGFTSHVRHVEAIFVRHDESMARKRTEVANRVVTNEMANVGSLWQCGVLRHLLEFPSSRRVVPHSSYQMLEVLADGEVCYDACSGPNNITITENLNEWHISSGTGLIIVTNAMLQHGQSFVCVSSQRDAYHAPALAISHKMTEQLRRLHNMVSDYRSEQAPNSRCWRLFWGTGNACWL